MTLHTYNFNTLVRIQDDIFQGTSILTLILNPNNSYNWNLKTTLKNMSNMNFYDMKGIGFGNNFSFNSAYNGQILSFDKVNGILNLYSIDNNMQIQGTQISTTNQNEEQAQQYMTDTIYNTYNNFNGGCGNSSKSNNCSRCGSNSCCGGSNGITNIINLNNRND